MHHLYLGWMSRRVRQLLQKLARLPWAYVIAFDIAALTALALAAALLFAPAAKSSAAPQHRSDGTKRIALSFDDAPRGPGAFLNSDIRPQMLLSALKRANVKQAVFFANPGRIDVNNSVWLKAYAKAGHVLANHTANHVALSDTSADAFLADIDKAEAWLKVEKGYRPWFRFPQLDEGGKNKAKRDAVRAGLKARGLRNGYVTADGWDWYMDGLALKASKAGKKMDANALRTLFVQTHVESANFADRLARRTLNRPVAHMLLLHETDLAVLYLEDLVAALRADGWTIITGDEAYADPMGKLPAPVIADANGTLIQMLSWDRKVKGPRWYMRTDRKVMTQLFNERVLRAQ
jgi:peptidoglycan-N-acetylglucosamine deacetylase